MTVEDYMKPDTEYLVGAKAAYLCGGEREEILEKLFRISWQNCMKYKRHQLELTEDKKDDPQKTWQDFDLLQREIKETYHCLFGGEAIIIEGLEAGRYWTLQEAKEGFNANNGRQKRHHAGESAQGRCGSGPVRPDGFLSLAPREIHGIYWREDIPSEGLLWEDRAEEWTAKE